MTPNNGDQHPKLKKMRGSYQIIRINNDAKQSGSTSKAEKAKDIIEDHGRSYMHQDIDDQTDKPISHPVL